MLISVLPELYNLQKNSLNKQQQPFVIDKLIFLPNNKLFFTLNSYAYLVQHP